MSNISSFLSSADISVQFTIKFNSFCILKINFWSFFKWCGIEWWICIRWPLTCHRLGTKFNINRRDVDIVDVWIIIYFNSRVRAQIVPRQTQKNLSNFRTLWRTRGSVSSFLLTDGSIFFYIYQFFILLFFLYRNQRKIKKKLVHIWLVYYYHSSFLYR